jgi:ABC-type glycerol-3-phosphate transport system substrate-binding protein
MNVGIPSVAGLGDFTNLYSQIYQRGGTLYTDDRRKTLLDSETSIEAFDYYVSLFTQYKTPVYYDFANRFRTGEMPLGFADFSLFNTLEIFAPEIRGMWKFGLMPGTKMPDGTINRSVACGGSAAMMFPNTENNNSEGNTDAWEFIKWWVSAETQLRFGLEMESVMGTSARYPTANIEAFNSLSWSVSQLETLNAQRQWTVGTPEIPGGYYLSRHITNAVRRMINNKKDTRETLLDYSRIINDELMKKRKELGIE